QAPIAEPRLQQIHENAGHLSQRLQGPLLASQQATEDDHNEERAKAEAENRTDLQELADPPVDPPMLDAKERNTWSTDENGGAVHREKKQEDHGDPVTHGDLPARSFAGRGSGGAYSPTPDVSFVFDRRSRRGSRVGSSEGSSD